MEENVIKSNAYQFFVVRIRISSLIRPWILISADNLLSCLSPLISVAASHFSWICDVTRLLCIDCIVAVNNAARMLSLIAI